ncbi:MAG: thiamine pyrophosphate-dependent enzyme [Planctomycetota bacterium]
MTGDYLDRSARMPYCPGCGHPHVLRALDDALQAVDLPHHEVALVTDIGCVGLADALFPSTHTVHTLHGRSAAIAAGLRMAQPNLKPVVLIGDGGAGIGLLHLVHAAQINVDITVLVHNNLVYGMTGGQHSQLTEMGMRTTTTPEGCPVPPLDLGAVLPGGFFGRAVAPGAELSPMIADAIGHEGFACVEVLELCPTFAARLGGVTGEALKEREPLGILRLDPTRPAFASSTASAEESKEAIEPHPAWRNLDRTARVVVAGRAGERVRSSALLAATAGAAAGLQVTVRADNPVTQGRGFSLAEITFAPEPVAYTGLVAPDHVIVTAPEGQGQLEARGLPRVDVREDLRKKYGAKGAALGGLVEAVEEAGWFKRRAWEAAIARLPPDRRADAEAVLQKSDPTR